MHYSLKRIILAPLNLLYKLNPSLELKLLYRIQTGKKLSLSNPTLYNEKLQWLKLNYRDPIMPYCVDKYTVREVVKKRGLNEILTPLLWEGVDPDKIPFENLPSRFVIKVTHGSGLNIICKDKNKLNIKSTKKKLNKWLKTEFLPCYGEWYYGQVKPRIIIEELLTKYDDQIPEDYKILSFNGKPKYIVVDTDRFSNHKRNIYNLNWELMEGYNMEFPNDAPIEKPQELEKMLKYASILSKDFPHVRVDFFQVNGEVYFGELTFSNGSGFDTIYPEKFNEELGGYIKINDNMEKNLIN